MSALSFQGKLYFYAVFNDEIIVFHIQQLYFNQSIDRLANRQRVF